MEEHNLQNQPPQRRRGLGPILWPLLLIGFGILLLLNSLGLMQQNAWSLLWNLWPLLFMAMGFDALLRKKEIFGPVFWMGLGGVFVLYNFGLVGWEAWNALFRLWPLLLVTAGVEILLGRRSIWLSLLVSALILGILVVALNLAHVGVSEKGTLETSINEPLGNAKRAEINIAMGVGELRLVALTDSNALISGQVSSEGASVRSQTKMNGDTIVYTLEHNNPIFVPFDNAWQWDLGLTTEIPVELESSMGVGAMNLELDQMLLEQTHVGQGVGEVEIILPNGDYQAEISQGVGQIILEIPRETPVRLEISKAISGLSLPPGFEKYDGYHYSPGARGADAYIKIEISQAIGNITVRYR